MSSTPPKVVIEHELQLSAKEYELILAIRERWRFGEITLVVRDGQPQYLKRVLEIDDLSGSVHK